MKRNIQFLCCLAILLTATSPVFSMFDPDGRLGKPANNGVSASDIWGANAGNVNVNDLLTWGMQNPNATISGRDNASGWIAAGQAMANGTLSNPQYINGYTDQFGRQYQTFCYSCHDPNDPIAQLKLGAAYNTVNTSIPAFVAQNALAFVPAEGMIGGSAGVLNNVVRNTENTLAVSGRQWYDFLAQKYGAQNVDWVSGAGRTIQWPGQLPVPTADRMFRVVPPERSSAFVSELINAQGPRPPDSIAHHVQFLQLNGVDNGAVNGAWVPRQPHGVGHGITTPFINNLPYGTEIVIKPPVPGR